jgi:hypothetical protein
VTTTIRLAVRLAVLGCVVLVGIVPAADQAPGGSELDGLPIVRIVLLTYDVFDTSEPETSSWPYRAANSVHIKSTEGFVRSMLLFAEGEPYNQAAALESARLLRSLGIMNPVMISAKEVEGGVEVTVETHDQWSLQLGADAGVSGSRGNYGIQLQEENLLGWGKNLTLGYDSDVERDTRSIRYRDPNIFNRRWTADLIYELRSDGSRNRVRVERPFFALDTERAWGGWWETEELIEHLYSESESVVEGLRSEELIRGWYGIRLGADGPITRRLTVGWDRRSVQYGDWAFETDGAPYPTPDALDVSGIRVGYERIADSYEVLRGFRSWSSQEDVALGPNLSIAATVSIPAFGGDARRTLFEGAFSVGRHVDRWLVLGDVWASGRFDHSDAKDVVGGFQLVAAQVGERGFQLRLLAEDSHELDLDRQLTLGADNGLRGWDPDTFDGTGRALANAQWRTVLFRDVLHLFSVGAVVFVDAGATWDPRVGRDTGGVRSDAGVGLLFDLSRVSTTNLARIEIAWPDDGSGYVVSILGTSLF